MARSKKLTHQLSRYLASETAEDDLCRLHAILAKLDSELLPKSLLNTLENLPVFLNIVETSYQKYEENLAVAERNISVSSDELVQANRSIKSMVNSLGQGFLMFDSTGICSPVYSKACETLLETNPSRKHISTVLKLSDENAAKLASLLKLVFSGAHAMSFQEIMRFAPTSFIHSEGIRVHLDYKPDISTNGRVDRIILVATDITEQVKAQELANQRQSLFETIERISHDRESFFTYIRRAIEITNMLGEASETLPWQTLLREIHTLKGGAGMFRLQGLADKLHDLESAVKPFSKEQSSDVPTPNPEADKIIAKHYGLLKEELDTLATCLDSLLGIDVKKEQTDTGVDKKRLFDFAVYLKGLNQPELHQAYIQAVCSESLKAHLSRYNLVLNDLAAMLNKNVHPLSFEGEDVPVVIDYYRDLFQSFIHIFRNIIDHGIEPPEIRQEEGKEQNGFICIKLRLVNHPITGKQLCIDISDDGAGVDIEKLRQKLADQAPNENWQQKSEADILKSILTHNVSSRDSVSIYSGRGTGMGAVYAEVQKLNGIMTLETTKGKGCHYHIEFPYRLEWQG